MIRKKPGSTRARKKSTRPTEEVDNWSLPSENRKQRHDVHNLLMKESDRGCVLVAGAMLDEQLIQLFRSVVASGTLHELIEYNGPLGAFSSKIQMAYALGLIYKEDFDDLHLFRRIRNDAAHFERGRGDGYKTGFTSPATISRIGHLSLVKKLAKSTKERSWRMTFIIAASYASGRLSSYCSIYEGLQKRAKLAPLGSLRRQVKN